MHRIQRIGGVAALVASAVLATSACGSGADDPDASAVPADTAPASTVGDVPETTVTPAETTTSAAPDDPTTTVVADDATSSTGIAVPSPFGARSADSEALPVQWLLPWDDGFLAMAVRSSPVVPPEFETVATWSMDGEDWTSLDITPPDGFGVPAHVVVFGDRLTMVGSPVPDPATPFPVGVSVASTTDLEAWVMDTFEVEVPNSVPETVMVSTHPSAVAANDDGWVVSVMTNAFVDPNPFLPDSARELLEQPDVGLGVNAEGIAVERFDDGGVTLLERFTWDELDVPEDILPYLWGDTLTMTQWGGPWGGQPAATPGASFPVGALRATSAGFLDLAEDPRYSPDGSTWSAVATPQPNLRVEATAPLDGGVMAFTRNAGGEVAVYRVDPTGETWTMLDVPDGVHDQANSWSSSSSPGFLLETITSGPGPGWVVVQHEGFELTMTYGADRWFELVDVSTGQIVLEDSIDLTVTQEPPDGPFEHVVHGINGLMFIDPGTGEVVVSIPHSVIGEALGLPDWDADDVSLPDSWVLATHDGEVWLLADCDEGDADEPEMPALVATNDDFALVGSPGWEPGNAVWQRFSMPG